MFDFNSMVPASKEKKGRKLPETTQGWFFKNSKDVVTFTAFFPEGMENSESRFTLHFDAKNYGYVALLRDNNGIKLSNTDKKKHKYLYFSTVISPNDYKYLPVIPSKKQIRFNAEHVVEEGGLSKEMNRDVYVFWF